MRILLLSAYDAASHRRWHRQLVAGLHDWQWAVLTLPPRNFAWRSRSNPMSWAFGNRDVLDAGYDLVLATSMVELAELKGIVPSLARTPSVVYFHENQFDYPERHVRKESQHYKLNNLYTALAADRVLYNSEYNRDSYIAGAREYLEAMPDFVPEGIVESIADKASLLPVPLEERCFVKKTGRRQPFDSAQGPEHVEGEAGGSKPLEIVWNHRWEYDKAPERFFDVLYRLAGDGLPFKVHVMGQRFREVPDVFEQAEEMLQGRIATWGFVERAEDYRRILSEADVAVSTALHDFQGLALLEAVAAGCVPLVPDRLAYTEYVPEKFRYASFAEDAAAEEEALYGHLKAMAEDPEDVRATIPPDVSHLSWNALGPRYRQVLEEVASVER
jgi:glycosyltransferase involved in cell wall biosynthesis